MKTSTIVSSTLVSAAAGFCGSSVAIGNEFMRALAHAASQVFKGSGDNPFPALIEGITTQKGVNKFKALAVKDTAIHQVISRATPEGDRGLVARFSGKLTTEQKKECEALADLFALEFMSEYENIFAQYRKEAKAQLAKAKEAKAKAKAKEAPLPLALVTVDEVETITASTVTSAAYDAGSLSSALSMVADGIDLLTASQLIILRNALVLHDTEQAIKALMPA